MPILKSAKKALRQSLVRKARNYRLRRTLKDVLKEVTDVTKSGKAAEAQKVMSKAYKIIDTAAKKHIIHKKNAAHKKSHVSKMIAGMGKKKAEAKE